MYLDDVISFGGTITEALVRLEEVLSRLSNFGIQLKAKKCTFMQTEVVFFRRKWTYRGRTGLCTSDGGLFLSVDAGLSVAGQDCHFGGGCFLQ